jgi:hypothetical protein
LTRQPRTWWRARYLALAIWDLIFPTREEVVPKSIGLELLEAENMAKPGDFSIEPPRVCRRPQLLGEWGHGNEQEAVEQIFT